MRYRLMLAGMVSLLALLAFTGVAAAAEITTSSRLERIIITGDLSCQVKHQDDSVFSFFGGASGACGTFVATGGILYGPQNCPACGSAEPRTPYTQVSQTGPTGSGTTVDPYRIVTVVDLGASGLRIEETDSYVNGDEAYRTDVRVLNTGTAPATGIVYRAGDCFLQDSDNGFGRADGEAISCVGDDPNQAGDQPGPRIEQFLPVTAGSSYYESGFNAVWARIGSQQPFTDSCEACAVFVDNGAGLSWPLTVAGGGSSTYSSFITFSPLGRQPLQTSKTADSSSSTAGADNGYTITISNPNTTDAVLNTITDTLPAGFSYRPGTTTEPGGGTDDPAISGQDLTWSGPYTVPAGGSVQLHFGVRVSDTPGTYTNQAGGDSTDFTVIPTGPTAPITVTDGGPPPARGHMTGEGRLTQSASNKLDFAYDRLNCVLAQNANPKFAGKRNTQVFKVTAITAMSCTDDPTKTPANPTAEFDTMEGDGTGTVGTTAVKVHFKFVDGGAAGTNDSSFIEIRRSSDDVVIFTKSEGPIGAYGGGTRPGRNTAYPPPAT